MIDIMAGDTTSQGLIRHDIVSPAMISIIWNADVLISPASESKQHGIVRGGGMIKTQLYFMFPHIIRHVKD